MPDPIQTFLQGMKDATAGKLVEAERAFKWLSENHPNPVSKVLLATLLPAIYESRDHLKQWRSKIASSIDGLVQSGLKIDCTVNLAVPEFMSAYAGLDDRRLHEQLAKLYTAPQPALPERFRDGRIHIGFVSGHLREHTIGRLNRGMIRKLPRDRFHVTVFSVNPPKDELATAIQKSADDYAVVGGAADAARQVILRKRPDILFFCDVGMEPMSYTLALSRLAPLQVVTWGHPVTTGLETLDWFLSSRLLDLPESSAFYTEQLARPERITVYYDRVEAPSNLKSRAELGLPADKTVYGCPQTLIKLHPDFDHVLAEILRGDRNGVVALLRGSHENWEKLLLERFARTMPDVADRIIWTKRQDRRGFLSLMHDVMLDPLHFGGGNTTYESIGVHTPVVTMPSQFLKGRISHALYQQIGMGELCAESEQAYVQLALRLGTDRDYRDEVRTRLRDVGADVFEDDRAVMETANWLEEKLKERGVEWSEMTGLPFERKPDVVKWSDGDVGVSIGRAVICTSADASYAGLVLSLVESLRLCNADDRFSVVVLDFGIPAAAAEELRKRGARLVKPAEDLIAATRPVLRAFKCKSMLPRVIPGFDTYVWLDADTIVMDGGQLLRFAATGAGSRAAVVLEQFGDKGVIVPGMLPNGSFGTRMYNNGSVRAGLRIAYEDNFGMRFRTLADDWLVSSAAFAMSAKSDGWEAIQSWFDRAESGRSSPLAFQQALTIAILSGRLPACSLPETFGWTCTTRVPAHDPTTRKFVHRATMSPISILHLGELRRLKFFDFPTLQGTDISLPLDASRIVENIAFSRA